jgi:hypothetical protein
VKQSVKLALNLALTLLIIVSGAWLILNRQGVIDWWTIQQFVPSAEVKDLIVSTGMTERGRDLVYASRTQIDERETFNQNCSDVLGEESLVLGCYKAQRIYVYNVTDTRLAGVKEVTTAHEMLHAAYERMNESDKAKLKQLLEPQIQAIKDQRLLDLMGIYNKQEPGELYNEMHSILATEVRDLSPALENYYKQYFTDRYKVVSYSESYESLFTQSKARIAEIEARMASLKEKIDANNATIRREDQELKDASIELDRLKSADQMEAFSQQAQVYNAKVRAFNARIQETRALITEYNQLVEDRNNEAAAQNELRQGLDSKYTTK